MGSTFEGVNNLGYSLLKDLMVKVDEKLSSLCLCFWVFLPRSTPFPCTILHQLHSADPFLTLTQDKRLMLSPTFFFKKEAPDSLTSIPSAKVPCVVSEAEFPLGQWVHFGCEVSSSVLRFHLDGKIVAERALETSLVKGADFQNFIGYKGYEGLNAYVHSAEILPATSFIKEHYVKDPPLRLYIDSSSTSDIEANGDGVWSIVGGKASGRKTFSMDVSLLDAFGEPVDKELEIVASLIYADDRGPVEQSEDAEAPLLTIRDGLEFPSCDRPIKLLHGRASFKLKISQLSSKCDNKLFCIKFDVPEMRNYPFLEAFSPPIHCISRARNSKISTITWKKLPSGIHLVNGSSSPRNGVGHSELQQNAVYEARSSPPLKRVKLGRDSTSPVTEADTCAQRPDEECNSYTVAANKVPNAIRTSLESIQENYGETDNSASDSESVGARNSESKNRPCSGELISDLTIFRYCLGGLSEKSLMLKEISSYVSEQEIADLAEQISFFSGCSHHRHQIMMAKGLLEEGDRAWNLISQNSNRVNWDNVVFEIEEQFMRIACCSTRSLTQQDLNFLRRISGGHEYMTRDDFDKMWRWLYPVAFTISRQGINGLWASTSPKWIEGFVTKEEVEYALQNLSRIQKPGTFILRFPTSRSWPHPDAGSLIASYVGRDFSLHHRQLSLDYSSSGKFDTNSKSLQELLLSEPELSQVGRMTKSDLTV